MIRSPRIPPGTRKTAAGVLTAAILLFAVITAGCFEEWPVSPIPVQTPVATSPSPSQTAVPGGAILPGSVPGETLSTAVGYVERPYGYAPYLQSMAQSISILDRGQTATDDLGQQVITGKIKNIGVTRIDYIVLTFTLYNRNGEVIGNTHARLNYLPPGKVWKFQSDPILTPGYSSHEIADVFTG